MRIVNKVANKLNTVKRAFHGSVNSSCISLIYHRVTHLKRDPQLLSVTPENFYEQIQYLKKKYCLLTIEEFLHIKKSGFKRFPKNSFILTFDDGYADNLNEALPILESLNAQALFYICTEKVNTEEELWWDELERIFFETQLPPSINIPDGEKFTQYEIKSPEQKESAYRSIHWFVKNKNTPDQKKIISQLAKTAGIDLKRGRKSHFLMTEEEIKKMRNSKSAVIGAHTVHHNTLSVLPVKEQFDEINNSKLFLEKLVQKPVVHFSYPFGSKADYNKDTVAICSQLGFEMVSSNFPAKIFKRSSDYELPRFLVRDWNLYDFSDKVNTFLK
jgi:peptidoglycan/xylan/chitin deacetylase (PgdA/CDA1 family)